MWSIRVDAVLRVTYVRMSGLLTPAEMRAIYEALRKHPDFDPTFPAVLDLRDVTDVRATFDQLQELSGESPVSPEACRVIVAGSPAVYGVARMYEAANDLRVDGVSRRQSVLVCRTLDDAATALAIDGLGAFASGEE